MDRTEHNEIIQAMLALVSPDNQATATELLTRLNDGFESVMASNDALSEANNTLSANNEKLRSVNANLFLKVGTTDRETLSKETITEPTNDFDPLPFEALFNERGELM